VGVSETHTGQVSGIAGLLLMVESREEVPKLDKDKNIYSHSDRYKYLLRYLPEERLRRYMEARNRIHPTVFLGSPDGFWRGSNHYQMFGAACKL